MTAPHSVDAFTRSVNRHPPRHLGTRYDAAGRFLPEPGNTVVCHLLPGSASQQAVLKAREAMMVLPGIDRLAFTPVESLHMTLFQGVIEYRRRLPYWPDDVALNAPIDEVTALYCARLDSFTPGPGFRMKVTDLTPTGLILEGLDEVDRRALAEWRDRLAVCFGYRHPDHVDYTFHVTLAYLTDWLDDSMTETWRAGLAKALRALKAEAPVIDLAPPAFCTFEDMRRFAEIKRL